MKKFYPIIFELIVVHSSSSSSVEELVFALDQLHNSEEIFSLSNFSSSSSSFRIVGNDSFASPSLDLADFELFDFLPVSLESTWPNLRGICGEECRYISKECQVCLTEWGYLKADGPIELRNMSKGSQCTNSPNAGQHVAAQIRNVDTQRRVRTIGYRPNYYSPIHGCSGIEAAAKQLAYLQSVQFTVVGEVSIDIATRAMQQVTGVYSVTCFQRGSLAGFDPNEDCVFKVYNQKVHEQPEILTMLGELKAATYPIEERVDFLEGGELQLSMITSWYMLDYEPLPTYVTPPPTVPSASLASDDGSNNGSNEGADGNARESDEQLLSSSLVFQILISVGAAFVMLIIIFISITWRLKQRRRQKRMDDTDYDEFWFDEDKTTHRLEGDSTDGFLKPSIMDDGSDSVSRNTHQEQLARRVLNAFGSLGGTRMEVVLKDDDGYQEDRFE